MSHPNAAANAQVTNKSLVAHLPEYSVPLTAAVTHIYTYIVHISCKYKSTKYKFHKYKSIKYKLQ